MLPSARSRVPTRLSARQVDRAIAGVLAVSTLWHVWIARDVSAPLWLRVALPLLLDAPLLWRRRRPVAAFAVVSVGVVLQALLGREAAQGLELVGPVAVGLYSTARYASRGGALGGLALLVFAGGVNNARSTGIGTSAEIWSDAFWSLVQVAIWLAGRFMRVRVERRGFAQRAVGLEQELQQAAVEERSRIARELHDIVSHNLSVVVTQAAGARAVTAAGSSAPESLERIEESARQALVEMRRLLGVLRQGEDSGRAPQPGVAQLEALAATLQANGLEVDLRIDPGCRKLSPALDLSVYRIVQEALTNVLKHAGATRATVTIDSSQGGLTIQVADDGTEAVRASEHGYGLVGMRERAALFGGRLSAGPRDHGGFLVRVDLPVTAS